MEEAWRALSPGQKPAEQAWLLSGERDSAFAGNQENSVNFKESWEQTLHSCNLVDKHFLAALSRSLAEVRK